MKSAIAQLDFSVDVTCPYCEKEQDITRYDHENTINKAIFNNRWHDLEGYLHVCEFNECGAVFKIEKVEY